MDFSKTTLFILQPTNTLPTTGSTANLSASQFGVFNPNFTPTSLATITAQPYIFFAQGRPQTLPLVGTKKSENIELKNVVSWYKVTANSTLNPMIVDITSFSAVCGEDVTISLRLRSFYIDTAYFNGLTKSYTVTTPCCDCGSDPCTTVDTSALIDQFVTKINDTSDFFGVSQFITASNVGGTTLHLVGNTLAAEPITADLTNFPFQYDRLYFRAYAYKGPATSQDYNVWDNCDPFATVTQIQNSNYVVGSSLEAKQLEKNYFSYNTSPIARRIWMDVNFNGGFLTEVIDGTYYDSYYVTFKDPQNNSNNPVVPQDSRVIILNPTGQNASTISMITAFLGNPIDES